MSFLRCCLRGSSVVAALIALAACAQHASTVLPAGALNPAAIAHDAVPPDCKGQKTTKEYASVTQLLSTKGGSLCVPAFGGFGGTIKYPPANPSVKLELTSSTTNYDHMPNLGNGTPIFYMQLALQGGTSFGGNVDAGGGLTGKQIDPRKPYTVYGQAVIYNIPFNFGPCSAKASKGKYGGVIGGVGTLLKGVQIPGAATAVVEIYPGKETGTKC
ncbi:MAG TPA: hypothetical protein VGI15_01645 [Candidatus Cybelea sp.]